MKGIYVLILYNNKNREVNVGSLGKIKFKEGFYAYVGYSKGNVFKRISRHLSKRRDSHLHIDYLLKHCTVKLVYYSITDKNLECEIAKNINLTPIRNFGSSNCSCKSHLFYSKNISELKDRIENAFKKLGLDYKPLFC